MLVIRDKQLNALAEMRTTQFVERMVEYVAADFPHPFATLKEEGVRNWIADILQFGARHRIESNGALAVLLQLTMMFGARLERSPDAEWAIEFLAKESVPDTLRLRMIRDRLSAYTQGRAIRKFEPGTPSGV